MGWATTSLMERRPSWAGCRASACRSSGRSIVVLMAASSHHRITMHNRMRRHPYLPRRGPEPLGQVLPLRRKPSLSAALSTALAVNEFEAEGFLGPLELVPRRPVWDAQLLRSGRQRIPWIIHAVVTVIRKQDLALFRLRGTVLHVDPCIPRTWPRYEIVFRYHSARYRLSVENPRGAGSAYGAADGRARLVPITLGHRGRIDVEVLDGVREGDQLIIHPGDDITPDRRVTTR